MLLLLLLLFLLYVDVIKWCYNVRGKGLSQNLLVDEAVMELAKSDVGVYEGSVRGLRYSILSFPLQIIANL